MLLPQGHVVPETINIQLSTPKRVAEDLTPIIVFLSVFAIRTEFLLYQSNDFTFFRESSFNSVVDSRLRWRFPAIKETSEKASTESFMS